MPREVDAKAVLTGWATELESGVTPSATKVVAVPARAGGPTPHAGEHANGADLTARCLGDGPNRAVEVSARTVCDEGAGV